MKVMMAIMQKLKLACVPRSSWVIQGVFVLVFSVLLSSGALGTTVLDPDPTPEPGSTKFGHAFAVVGDVNGDGVRDIVATAPFQDGDFNRPGGGVQPFGPPQDVGKAWVLSGTDFSIIRVLDDPYFQIPELLKFGAQFGTSISATGDLNGDGVGDIIIGLPHRIRPVEDDNLVNAGEAIVFSGSDGSVLLTLQAPEAHESGRFGYAVAGIGDVNGDGVSDLLVGEPKNDSGETGLADVGTIYVFSGADGSLIRQMDAPDLGGAEQNGRFGMALANAGDLDQDGVSDYLVGSPGNSRVYAISGATGAVLYNVVSPQLERLASFGVAIAAGKDLNNDGIPDFVIGSPNQSHLSGIAYAFSGRDGSLLWKLSAARQAFAKFGWSVALINDVTGDGLPDILIGAPDHTVNGLLNAGEAFVFNGSNGKLFKTVTAAAPKAYASFGFSVDAEDLNGNGVIQYIVGAPLQDVDLYDPITMDIETHLQMGQLEIQ